MACLIRYRWLKLPRAFLPSPKGISGYWSRLAARAAFRKGIASYCGHRNPVEPGTWAGGIVGVKSILSEEKLHQTDVLYRLNISRRHYYRLKEQAINIISLRLWSVPSTNIDLWLDLVSMLSGRAKPSGR